ncbi:MAG: DUF3192 domain-containing protein [Thermodesulfobacteriota bacterium]|nr:DUF3192 domain-containing protein [Thermodesulfobacteriota bacterium]
MKKVSLAMTVLLFTAFVCACSGPYTSMKTNRENIVTLKPGMSMEQVVEIMGCPDFKDMYTVAGMERTALYYFTNEMGNKGFTASVTRATVTREDCTKLIFKNNKLFISGEYAKTYQ